MIDLATLRADLSIITEDYLEMRPDIDRTEFQTPLVAASRIIFADDSTTKNIVDVGVAAHIHSFVDDDETARAIWKTLDDMAWVRCLQSLPPDGGLDELQLISAAIAQVSADIQRLSRLNLALAAEIERGTR
jgi:hypothetical protein